MQYRRQRWPKDEKEELELARAPDTHPDWLEMLSECQSEVVRQAVAEHPNAQPETLAGLVPPGLKSLTDIDLAIALARNNNTPDYALERLHGLAASCIDKHLDFQACLEFRIALCCNPNMPFQVIKGLLAPDQSTTDFRVSVARQAHRADVLQLLTGDRSKLVREQALQTSRGTHQAN